MAFDKTKPVASGFLNSAEIRANWTALEASLSGQNWFADPGHLIWPYETSNGAASQTNPPAHYILSGTGATVQRCGTGLTDTTDYESGGWACELSYGSATAYLYQNLLPNAAIPDALAGLELSGGMAVKCSSSNAARIFFQDSTGIDYSSYHTGGGAWEWLTIPEWTIGDSTSGIQFGVELGSGTCHVQGGTVLLGQIAPTYPIPCNVNYGAYLCVFPGTPTSATYAPSRVMCGRPFLFTGAACILGTGALSGGTMTWNIRKYDSAAWADMLSAAVTMSDTHNAVSSTSVDSVYAYRCVDSVWGASQLNPECVIIPYVASNAGGGQDPNFWIRGLQFNLPQDQISIFMDADAI